MKITRTGGLAAICAGAAMIMAAPVANAANAGVNIIYPPKLASDFDQPDEAPAADKTVVTVRIYRSSKLRNVWKSYHKFHTERALFQRYPSDRRKFGGKLYPF